MRVLEFHVAGQRKWKIFPYKQWAEFVQKNIWFPDIEVTENLPNVFFCLLKPDLAWYALFSA